MRIFSIAKNDAVKTELRENVQILLNKMNKGTKPVYTKTFTGTTVIRETGILSRVSLNNSIDAPRGYFYDARTLVRPVEKTVQGEAKIVVIPDFQEFRVDTRDDKIKILKPNKLYSLILENELIKEANTFVRKLIDNFDNPKLVEKHYLNMLLFSQEQVEKLRKIGDEIQKKINKPKAPTPAERKIQKIREKIEIHANHRRQSKLQSHH